LQSPSSPSRLGAHCELEYSESGDASCYPQENSCLGWTKLGLGNMVRRRTDPEGGHTHLATWEPRGYLSNAFQLNALKVRFRYRNSIVTTQGMEASQVVFPHLRPSPTGTADKVDTVIVLRT